MNAMEGPDDGHTFRLAWTLRGSTAVVGDQHHTDSDYWSDVTTVEVRAFSLKDALLKAADLPFAVLMGYPDGAPDSEAERASVDLP